MVLAVLSETVIVALPTRSATVASAAEKFPTSSSVIVIVSDCVPLSLALPPETESIDITAVSFPSAEESLVGVKFTVPVVLPALIVISSTLPLPSV